MNTLTVAQTAEQLTELGFSVIPIGTDGTKVPAIAWRTHMKRLATPTELQDWFGGRSLGLGVVCGQASDNLEMFEFEGRAVANGTYQAFLDRANEWGMSDIVAKIATGWSEESPKGGIHWIYRANKTEGSLRLAKQDDDEILIETRGEGGYTVVAPTGGTVHETGKPWKRLSGGPESLALLLVAERERLLDLARSFDKRPVKKTINPAPALTDGLRPGDAYSASPEGQTEAFQILRDAGWKEVPHYGDGQVVHLCRPDKNPRLGASATFGYVAPGVFYVFSSSAPAPFEAEHSYSPFAVFALLKHGGDFAAATRELAMRGFGDPLPPPILKAKLDLVANDATPAPPGLWYECTDLGNCYRLVARHPNNLRYVCDWGAWLIWDGNRWREDQDGQILRMAKDCAEAILLEADATEIDARRQKLIKWWQRSQSKERLRAMIDLAWSEPGVPVTAAQLDTQPMLFGVGNGVLDLESGGLRAGGREDLVTCGSDVVWNPEARCDEWLKFLETIVPDADIRDWLQRAVGYTLTGRVDEQVLLFLHGTGANGKSTFLGVIEQILGSYASQADKRLLLASNDEHPTQLADLKGKRLVVCQELDEGKRMAEALVKTLTGGDRIKARRMRQDFFEFSPTHKVWLVANHKPEIRGTDYAIWRRIRLVPFEVTIAEDKRDAQLMSKLLAEAEGILAWAVEGCKAWQERGLEAPEGVRAATDAWRSESDVVGSFVDEACEVHEGLSVPAKELRAAFELWCEGAGINPLNPNSFGRKLTDRGFVRGRVKAGRVWHGLGLHGYSLTNLWTNGESDQKGDTFGDTLKRSDQGGDASDPGNSNISRKKTDSNYLKKPGANRNSDVIASPTPSDEDIDPGQDDFSEGDTFSKCVTNSEDSESLVEADVSPQRVVDFPDEPDENGFWGEF